MTLARLTHAYETAIVDVALDEHGFVALDGGLETAVFLSLFTDRRARESDRESDRRGWWGDAHARVAGDEIGSWLWLLRRRPASRETVRRAQLYALQALEWLRVDGLAKSVDVVAERRDTHDAIVLAVTIVRPGGDRWAAVWDVHGKRVSDGGI